MQVPVTLPLWIVRDGTLPVPDVGDIVSDRVTFASATNDDLPTLRVTADVHARTLTNRNGTTRGELTFPSFTASYFGSGIEDGFAKITGRLFVEHELRVEPETRLTGTVVDRRLLVEEELLPTDPKQLKIRRPSSQELYSVEDVEPQRLLESVHPELGTAWRRPTGVVLYLQT